MLLVRMWALLYKPTLSIIKSKTTEKHSEGDYLNTAGDTLMNVYSNLISDLCEVI